MPAALVSKRASLPKDCSFHICCLHLLALATSPSKSNTFRSVCPQGEETYRELGTEREEMDDNPDEKGINQWSCVDQFPEHLEKYIT
jgi:hypothetical protein